MRPVMPAHLLLMTWLLWLQANWREAGAQTVCPQNENRCTVNADSTRIYLMTCTNYGDVTQLPPACTDTRIISNLVIGHRTTVNTLQHRILDGLQMQQLELTGLGIRSITESAFEAISSKLQVLNLQDNQLESLPLGAFRTLLSLSRLHLNHNRLTQLSDGVFSGLTNLVHLTLNVNRISAMDPGTWYALPRLVTLALEDNRLGDGRLLFPDMAMDHLEELRLDRNRLGAINDDIISGLPNLRRLFFRENGVQSLPNNAFRAVPRLEVVDLSTNNISQLTQASLNGSTSLTTLALDENRIQLLPDSLFLNLNTLRILRLRGNKISDVYSNSFIGLVGLRELDLSQNRIPDLPLGIFDPLGLLQTLSLANNEIRHVEHKPFQSCRNLLSFDMANNLLPSVGADWFVTTTRLSFLRLAYNQIEEIHPAAFSQLQELKELDLSENYLTDLTSDLFINCRSLQKLNLARNPLREFASPGTTFYGLTALKQLDLTGCCITKLVLNSSAPLPALTELYLGDNLLSEVSRYSLAAATSLQRLDLGDNSILALDAGALSSLASLNWLNLSRNLLTEDQLAAAVRSAPSDVIVDVSWNRVNSLALLSSPLRGIYLSGNPLLCSCTSPSWISLADTSRLLDATSTLCFSGSEPFYLLCYWSRCGSFTGHQLCNAPFPSNANSILVSPPSKICRLTAALAVFGPRFIDFDAQSLSPTSCQLTWNISDEFSMAVGFKFTFTVVDNCTNASAAAFSPYTNETSYSIYNDNINSTTIDIGNLTSGTLYSACAHVLQTLIGDSNRTSVSDTRCTCLEMEQTTTALPSSTTTTTSTTTAKTTPLTTTTTSTTTSTTTTTTTPTTTTTTTTTVPTTTVLPTTTKKMRTTSMTTTTTTTLPPTTTTASKTTTTTPLPTTTTTKMPTTSTTTITTTTSSPTTTTVRPTTTTTTTMTETTTADETSAYSTETTTMVTMRRTIIHTQPMDLSIWATWNGTAIFVTWNTQNSTEHVAYFWLIWFDDEDRQVGSAEVDVQSYVIGNLSDSSTYNVCVTAITNQDHMDPTRCVVVGTDGPPSGDAVRPTTEDIGLFLLIVIGVPLAGLLLVLIIVCIVVLVGGSRRRRRKQKNGTEVEMISSSMCDSSTGNCGQNLGNGPTSTPLSEQSVTTMNMYAELSPSAPPLQDQNVHMYSNTTGYPLPPRSSLSFNVYDNALSY